MKKYLRHFAVAACMATAAYHASAQRDGTISQTPSAQLVTISGIISDQTGAVVVGATIDVLGDSGLVRAVVTDASGRYELRDLPPGDYTLRITAASFQANERSVSLSAGSTSAIDIRLSVRGLQQQVEVMGGSLTVPTVEQAKATIDQIPGAVEVVPDTAYRNAPVKDTTDMLAKVPGIFVQTRWGDDGRISIHGSGLSRNYGNRDIEMLLNGVPLNTSDGYVEQFEIDPVTYRYVEVYKGADALRYGADSLGGAINFITQTGRDAARLGLRMDGGSFGYVKGTGAAGAEHGPFDWFGLFSAQKVDGFRQHSAGDEERGSMNLGYTFSPTIETRFFMNAARRRQEMPGEISKTVAISSPQSAGATQVLYNHHRNGDTLQLADKTVLSLGHTSVELGAFGHYRHIMHPIFQYIDFDLWDYGVFGRAVDDRNIGGFRNRLVTGINLHNGTIDDKQYVNLPGGVKGALAASYLWKSTNASAYGEDSFYILKNLALVGGTSYLHAVRNQIDRFLSDGDQSGSSTFDLWNPKGGVLWNVRPSLQIYGNISRSAAVPSYSENTYSGPTFSSLKAQRATTYEVGTRASHPDLSWDVSFYRANLQDELLCLTNQAALGACTIVNANKTVHQGMDVGFGTALFKSVFSTGDRFRINTSYTYSDLYFNGDPTYGNNRLPGLPPHAIRAELLYKHPSGFYVGPNTEAIPKSYFVDSANTTTADPYALLNFKCGFDREGRWSGYFEGRNLTNVRWIATVDIAGRANDSSALFFPGDGRAIYGGLRFKW